MLLYLLNISCLFFGQFHHLLDLLIFKILINVLVSIFLNISFLYHLLLGKLFQFISVWFHQIWFWCILLGLCLVLVALAHISLQDLLWLLGLLNWYASFWDVDRLLALGWQLLRQNIFLFQISSWCSLLNDLLIIASIYNFLEVHLLLRLVRWNVSSLEALRLLIDLISMLLLESETLGLKHWLLMYWWYWLSLLVSKLAQPTFYIESLRQLLFDLINLDLLLGWNKLFCILRNTTVHLILS